MEKNKFPFAYNIWAVWVKHGLRKRKMRKQWFWIVVLLCAQQITLLLRGGLGSFSMRKFRSVQAPSNSMLTPENTAEMVLAENHFALGEQSPTAAERLVWSSIDAQCACQEQ